MQDWKDRSVLVTGHTGFKGAWLSLMLIRAGAKVTGFALSPPTSPSLFETADLASSMTSVIGDVREAKAIEAVVSDARPEVVFHLAAQALVRYSYDNPIETYATNVMGTAHVLEAVRHVGGTKAIVAVTSDKCYENREWVWPYRETDPMGGHDPYSSSKGCAELVIAAYRQSYFDAHAGQTGHAGPLLASVRAGNVIGGGDWATDRLIPDLVRAFENGVAPTIRSPAAVRPWQHVLEALSGYLDIAENMLRGDAAMATAWNFGPSENDTQPVAWIVDRMARAWGAPSEWSDWQGAVPHEAGLLRLECSKARNGLGWRPTLTLDDALQWIVDWHRRVGAGEAARAVTSEQIDAFLTRRAR